MRIHKRIRRRRTSDSSQTISNEKFSKTVSRYIFDGEIDPNQETFIWECEPNFPFTELILSWNAMRPERGKLTFWVNIKHNSWAGWQRLAEWGATSQRTFVNKLNRVEARSGPGNSPRGRRHRSSHGRCGSTVDLGVVELSDQTFIPFSTRVWAWIAIAAIPLIIAAFHGHKGLVPIVVAIAFVMAAAVVLSLLHPELHAPQRCDRRLGDYRVHTHRLRLGRCLRRLPLLVGRAPCLACARQHIIAVPTLKAI